MAGKPRPMSQIKQLLLLHHQGQSRKFIARSLNISKNTVKSYLDKARDLGTPIEKLLDVDDPLLDLKFHAGNPAYKDNKRFDHLKDNLDYLTQELERPGVTKRLLWEEYRLTHPNGYGYTQYCHHLNQHQRAKKPSMVLSHKPGEKLYIDFAGKKQSYIDRETGEIISCPVFVACLPYSDYGFAMAVKNQGIDEFLYALRCCLEFLGGVPQIVVPDNLKSAIIKTNRYEPDINQALEDFANHYKFTVLPARVKHPKDKALVENQVKLIYQRVYAKLRNMQFFDLQSLNHANQQKVREHNQTRMQLKPYSREEKFLAEERELLNPLPTDVFEVKYYREYKVAQNNYVCLQEDKHYYSVPYQYIGQMTWVIYTRSVVRIYIKGNQVAVHIRDYRAGVYSTIKGHLCSEHQHYLGRSPEYYIQQAQRRSEVLSQVVQALFSGGRPPEQNYRTCDGLFSLHRRTAREVFTQACEAALEYKNYSYKFVQRVIENIRNTVPSETQKQPLPEHKNIRGREYYQTTLNFNNHDAD
jgi:transposase